MFAKLVLIAVVVVLAQAGYNGPIAGGIPAAQFPAGINPKSCPNYPNCENPAVAVDQSPISQYKAFPAPQQYQPQYNVIPQPQYNAIPQPQYNAIPQPQYNTFPQPQYKSFPQAQYNPTYQPQYNAFPQPQYKSAPQTQYTAEIQNALDRGEYIGDGDYHGEGIAESFPSGYDQERSYHQTPNVYSQTPQQYIQPTNQVPAGVDAKSCPNYPFCR